SFLHYYRFCINQYYCADWWTIYCRESICISNNGKCHYQFCWWCVLHLSIVKGEESMVNVKNVLKSYNQKKVVDDVSVEIEKGTITSFIGPNGAGKSTLISMISRLISRDD